MDKKEMTVEQAAKLLRSHLQGEPWVAAIGVGEENGAPCIVLYVKTTKRLNLDDVRQGWNGFPVIVRKMGSLRLLSSWPTLS